MDSIARRSGYVPKSKPSFKHTVLLSAKDDINPLCDATHLYHDLASHFSLWGPSRHRFFHSSLDSPFQKLQNRIFSLLKKYWPLKKSPSTLFLSNAFQSWNRYRAGAGSPVRSGPVWNSNRPGLHRFSTGSNSQILSSFSDIFYLEHFKTKLFAVNNNNECKIRWNHHKLSVI